jgi:hypothetical protein
MARYTSNKILRELTLSIASLDMKGYLQSKYQEGNETEPAFWPRTAVSGLVQLFTGLNPDSDKTGEGIEIPDCLGWHIAVLMDSWCDEACPLSEGAPELGPAMGMAMEPEYNNMEAYMAWKAGSHPTMTAVEYAGKLLETQHARHRQNIVHQWYSDGIQLYQATRLFDATRNMVTER